MTPDFTLSSLTQPSGPPPGRRRRKGLLIALAAACAVALVATSVAVTLALTRNGSRPAAASSPTPSWSSAFGDTIETQATPPSQFQDADELRDYLNSHALYCGSGDEVSNPTNATSMVDCGPDVVIAVYADHEHAAAQFEVLQALLKQINKPVHIAIGSNWTVSADDATYVQAVADKLGGVYRTT